MALNRIFVILPVSKIAYLPGSEVNEFTGSSGRDTPNDLDGGYDNWCAVASFFDGDGCVQVGPKKDTLVVKLEFVDNWRLQLEQLLVFLHSGGISTGQIKKKKGGAHEFVIVRQAGVITAAVAMLATRCCFKKRRELEWVLQYFDDRLTGTDFIERMNDDVRCGNRTGKIRHADVPFSHSVGSRQRYLRIAMRRRVLTEEQKKQIVTDRSVGRVTLARLAAKYGVSITTIARALGSRKD